MSSRDLLGQDIDTLIVERRETTKQGIEHTAKRPHVNALGVSLVLDDLGRSVSDGAAWRHRLLVPNDLGEAEIGNLDASDASTANARNKLAFILLLLVVLPLNRVLRRDNGYPFEQQVLWFDVTFELCQHL